MTIDNKLKKYNTILIKKLQKYQPYQQAKLINTNIKYPNILIHHLEKPFKKKTKQGEKQGKTTEEHGEQLVESNALIKKCDTGKESTPFLK